MTRRSKVLTIYTDGVARGNPGEGGYGVIIKGSDGNIVEEIGGYIGETTNNFAEYSGNCPILRNQYTHQLLFLLDYIFLLYLLRLRKILENLESVLM